MDFRIRPDMISCRGLGPLWAPVLHLRKLRAPGRLQPPGLFLRQQIRLSRWTSGWRAEMLNRFVSPRPKTALTLAGSFFQIRAWTWPQGAGRMILRAPQGLNH